MLRSSWILLVAALLATGSSAAVGAADGEEGGFHLFGTMSTWVELNDRNLEQVEDSEYWKVKGLFTLNAAWESFSAGAQLEYLHFSDEELVDPLDLDRLRDTWELRKYFVDYSNEHFEGRIGTFFTSFGRGLTLYVQKDEALGLDEPVHGATATATLGRFDLTVLGGKVTEPLLENQLNRSFEDTLWGGRVVIRLPKDLYFGATFVGTELDTFYTGNRSEDVEVWSVEGGGNAIAGLFDIHAEWAEIERVSGLRRRDGHGRYLSLSSSVGPLTLLGEVKDYLSFEYRYNAPPTAGRNVEAYDHNDVRGARLLVEADIAASGTLVYGSYGVFDTHREPGTLGALGDEQVEWYVGVEEYAGPVYFEGSYFDRDWRDREIQERHIVGDFHYSVAATHELIFGYDSRLEESAYFRTNLHRSFAAFSWSPWGTLSLRYSWEESQAQETEDFWGVSLDLNPSQAFIVSLFVGADPGGLVCSGGQCREEPRFDGFKTRVTWRF